MIATRGRGDTGTRGKSRPSPRLRVPPSPRLLTFSGGRIGPSVQLMMTAFSIPGMTQPRQAPKPHPISASVENSEGRRRPATIGARAANIGMGPQA